MTTNFTPEEAAFLTGMPFSSKSLEEPAAMKNMAPDELGPRLDALAPKGMVYKSVRGDSVRYRLNDTFSGLARFNLWPGRIDGFTKTISPIINRYSLDGWFGQYAGVHY